MLFIGCLAVARVYKLGMMSAGEPYLVPRAHRPQVSMPIVTLFTVLIVPSSAG